MHDTGLRWYSRPMIPSFSAVSLSVLCGESSDEVGIETGKRALRWHGDTFKFKL